MPRQHNRGGTTCPTAATALRSQGPRGRQLPRPRNPIESVKTWEKLPETNGERPWKYSRLLKAPKKGDDLFLPSILFFRGEHVSGRVNVDTIWLWCILISSKNSRWYPEIRPYIIAWSMISTKSKYIMLKESGSKVLLDICSYADSFEKSYCNVWWCLGQIAVCSYLMTTCYKKSVFQSCFDALILQPG